MMPARELKRELPGRSRRTAVAAVALLAIGCGTERSAGPEARAAAEAPRPGLSRGAPAPGEAPAAADLLPNGREPLPGVLTGGQPSRAQLEALAAAGYRTVVNLRAPGEEMPVGEAEVEALGMRWVHIPIAGRADLTEAKARELGALLADASARPMAIHCASGNRVGALVALEAAQAEGKSAEEALELGRAAGLGGMEPAVREALGLPPAGP